MVLVGECQFFAGPQVLSYHQLCLFGANRLGCRAKNRLFDGMDICCYGYVHI